MPLLSCDFPSSEQIVLGDLKRIGGLQTRKQIEGTGYDSSPSRLMAGAESLSIVPVEYSETY